MKIQGYYVAVLDGDKIHSVFDGSNYSTDVNKFRFFNKEQLSSARIEAGSYQRYNPDKEVRVLPFEVDIPIKIEEVKQDTLPALDTLA